MRSRKGAMCAGLAARNRGILAMAAPLTSLYLACEPVAKPENRPMVITVAFRFLQPRITNGWFDTEPLLARDILTRSPQPRF